MVPDKTPSPNETSVDHRYGDMIDIIIDKLQLNPQDMLTCKQMNIVDEHLIHDHDADLGKWQHINNDDISECLTEYETTSNVINKTSLQDINIIIDGLPETHTTVLTDEILEQTINDGWTLHAEINPTVKRIAQGQMDSGANTCVTNNRRLLQHYKNTKSIPVAGVSNSGPACYIQGYGYMDIMTEEGDWLNIKTYYAPQCSGTTISPNAIVQDHPEYTSWNQTSHLDTGEATLKLFNRSSWYKKKTIRMIKRNNLWFIKNQLLKMIQRASTTPNVWNYKDIAEATVNLTQVAQYELWHQR